jgi:uncharacterized protein (DUF934 family)
MKPSNEGGEEPRLISIDWPRWLADKPAVKQSAAERDSALVLSLDCDIGVDQLSADLSIFVEIIVHVASHTDGRIYSVGHIIRRQWAYLGILTATGDILVDQHHLLRRSGFDRVHADNQQSRGSLPELVGYQPLHPPVDPQEHSLK